MNTQHRGVDSAGESSILHKCRRLKEFLGGRVGPQPHLEPWARRKASGQQAGGACRGRARCTASGMACSSWRDGPRRAQINESMGPPSARALPPRAARLALRVAASSPRDRRRRLRRRTSDLGVDVPHQTERDDHDRAVPGAGVRARARARVRARRAVARGW